MGTNHSTKREAIYKTLCSTKTHPTAKWIYDEVKKEHPDIGIATVYRNLNFFIENHKVNVPVIINGEEHFDGDVSEHSHFVCERCDKVFDIFDVNINQYKDSLSKQEFIINKTNLVFYGLCKNCK